MSWVAPCSCSPCGNKPCCCVQSISSLCPSTNRSTWVFSIQPPTSLWSCIFHLQLQAQFSARLLFCSVGHPPRFDAETISGLPAVCRSPHSLVTSLSPSYPFNVGLGWHCLFLPVLSLPDSLLMATLFLNLLYPVFSFCTFTLGASSHIGQSDTSKCLPQSSC